MCQHDRTLVVHVIVGSFQPTSSEWIVSALGRSLGHRNGSSSWKSNQLPVPLRPLLHHHSPPSCSFYAGAGREFELRGMGIARESAAQLTR